MVGPHQSHPASNVHEVCVSSSLIYACESWGTSSVNSIEVPYRLGLKRALSIRETTNTEIVYTESDRVALCVRISKQQFKFWVTLKSYLDDDPGHPLKNLIQYGMQLNLPYLKYYSDLQSKYLTPINCETVMKNDFQTSIAEKIRSKSNNDIDSRLGVYLEVNPNLTAPSQCDDILECERVLITRYRCGSHNLNIEAGRLCNPIIPREERLCACNTDIQSLRHCLFDCTLL